MSHKPHQHSHDLFESRKQFQLERIILFSDAVFAIAITLLVIEIKIPHIEGPATSSILVAELKKKVPDLVAFVLSFAVIGQFWTTHHRLFGFVQGYTPKLLWLNLLVLLWIALMPFSTYLIMEFGNLDIIWLWYSTNLALISLSILFLWLYVGGDAALCTVTQDKAFLRYIYGRSIIVTLIFLMGGFMAFLPWESTKTISRFLFIIIFPVLAILKKRYNKKHPIKKPAL